ncbi:MAG: SDR family oxidoreductase [Deltaproteobacteria bacterium]|nr:SDR family oxidoreductase [Deltaproteobacteria bacterium]
MESISGRRALITGATKGIGKAIALRLGAAGARIAAAATSEDRLEQLCGELRELGIECFARPCDVTDPEQVGGFVEEAAENLGGIDILVNNAGVGYSGTVADSDPAEMEKMIRVNFFGVYLMTRMALPVMIGQGGGDIVNMGSVAGLKYSPNFAIYSATKFAVRAFSEALRNEVQGHGIRVTLIHPGMTRTPFFESFARGGAPLPLDREDILRPEDIARAVEFAVTRPEGVSCNEITVRPTWQER